MDVKQLLTSIAHRQMGIESLEEPEERHNVSAGELRESLSDAFNAGMEFAQTIMNMGAQFQAQFRKPSPN